MKNNYNELVTIIVPVYNVEMYIKQCIESLLSQTYKNIEIIAVNDGTLDNSAKIIEDIAKTDSRIKLINQVNSGVSSARNNGLKNANGKYIIFVDADDFLADDFVEYMLYLINNNNADFAYTIKNYWTYDEKQTSILFEKNIDSNKSVGLLLSPDVTVGCWNKIYRSEFLKNNDLKFRQDLYYGEGLNFIIRASILAKNITIGNKKVYYYRKNNLSSATTKYSNEKYHNGEKSLKIIESMIDFTSDYVKSMYLLHISTFYLGAIVKMIGNKKKKEYKKDYKTWKKQLNKNLIYILTSKYISFYRKCMLLVGAINPSIISLMDNYRVKRSIKKSVN